jgi:TrbL/VirB6 plasmid conjugal transfer protein
MTGIEQAIADVFATLENWLISTGATQSMIGLAWAVLTALWLGYVAMATRPGREPDLIDAFGRLLVAGGLLAAVGSLTREIVLMFETMRNAGTAVLNQMIGQSWNQFAQSWLVPEMGALFNTAGPLAGSWAFTALIVALLLGAVLFAVGAMVYLAILFFAHLTLLLAIFLAPLALALLASPATQRWTGRWLVVIIRTGLVVFCVQVIHAATLYLAVIYPVHAIGEGLQNTFRNLPGYLRTPLTLGPGSALLVLLDTAWMLFLMFVGTGVGVYTMLRAERLTGQFVEGVALGQGIFAWPLRLGGQIADAREGHSSTGPNVAMRGGESPLGEPAGAQGGGAQDATTMRRAAISTDETRRTISKDESGDGPTQHMGRASDRPNE